MSDEKHQAIQTAGEKLDRLIEATERNETVLREIRNAVSWMVFLLIPVFMSSCASLTREGGAAILMVGMIAIFGTFLAMGIATEFGDFRRQRRAKGGS